MRQTNDIEATSANGLFYGVDSSEDEDDRYVHGSITLVQILLVIMLYV